MNPDQPAAPAVPLAGSDAGAQPAPRPGYARFVLAMLLLVYTFNFLDRQILGILAQPIKADLGLTDTQLGALGGIAFALLYTTLAIPLALVADRTSRASVIAASLAVWSGFTALCGVATGFWQLFLFRLGVGVGASGGVAPSRALVAVSFPPDPRALPATLVQIGVQFVAAQCRPRVCFAWQRDEWCSSCAIALTPGNVLAP